MSWQFTRLVRMADIAPANHKLVCLILAEQTNQQTGICWPSIWRIALEAHLHVRTVQKILRDLEKRGILTVVANEKGGGRLTPHYRLNYRVLQDLGLKYERDKPTARAARRGGPQTTPGRGGPQTTPEQSRGGAESTPGVAPDASRGGLGTTQTGINRNEPERAHASAHARESAQAGDQAEQPNSRYPEGAEVKAQRQALRDLAMRLREQSEQGKGQP